MLSAVSCCALREVFCFHATRSRGACLERESGETKNEKKKVRESLEVESSKKTLSPFTFRRRRNRAKKRKKKLGSFLRIMSFLRYWMHRVSLPEASRARPSCSAAQEKHRHGTREVENERREIEFGLVFLAAILDSRPRRQKKKTHHLSFSLSPLFPRPPTNNQEPIITWSFIIGGIGLAIPLVVPPMRDALTPASRKQPPSVAQLLGREEGAAAAAATQKQ